jgi:hypothetical protein
MADISRRHFFFGTLLAGVLPRAGFGTVPSLKASKYVKPTFRKGWEIKSLT